MITTPFHRSVLLAALGAVVASIAVLIPAQPAAAAFAWNSAGRVNGSEASVLSYVNSARVARGIPALVAAVGTSDVARGWSARMASTSSLAHNPGMTAQVAASGSPSWRFMAENVGYAAACSPKQLFDAYWASTAHRANILDRRARYVGIGTYERAASGWSCGRAWNTMVFVDSYTSTYGASRNPPQGMAIDSRTITTSQSLATFESGSDARAVTGISGQGLWSSRPLFDAPLNGRDDSMHWSVAQSAPQAGWGSMYLRDAVDLRYAKQVRMTIQAVTPSKRGLPISLTVYRDWGAAATLGTVVADSVPRTYTFTVPTSVRGFNNNFRLTMRNLDLNALSSQMSGRKAYISVYQVDVVV